MRIRHGLLVLSLLSLAGCAHAPVLPKVVKVPVKTYVPIPSKLTADCPIAYPRDKTVGEAVRVASDRRISLERCNAHMKAIREIQGKAAPESQ